MQTLLGKIALRAALVTVSTLCTFVVFEITLRIGSYMPQYSLQLKELQGPGAALRITLHEKYLYVVQPNSGPEINNYGYRDADIGAKKPGIRRVAVIGDSFVMGNNLAFTDTLTAKLNKRLGAEFEVLNLGTSGYGPDQELLRFTDDSAELKPDYIVLSVFAGNDFRDIEKNAIFGLAADGELVHHTSNLVTRALPLTRTQILLSQVFRKRYLAKSVEDQLSAAFIQDKTEIFKDPPDESALRQIALMRGILMRFAETARERGIPLLVVVMPSLEAIELNMPRPLETKQAQRSFTNENALVQICSAAKIDFLDLSDLYMQNGASALYDAAYRHINSEGAAWAAETIAERIGISEKIHPK